MTLFEIDQETNLVRINKPWIVLHPDLGALIKRDKGEPRKEAGRSVKIHLRARREFTFIYFYTDFGSPLYDYEDAERLKESLVYADLEEKDLDKAVWTANTAYENLMMKAARSLRTYKALCKMLNEMDRYIEHLDMTKLTKTGELQNSPDRIANLVAKMDSMHTAVENFRKRVDNELKQQGSIRGAATLGDNESKPIGTWSESEIADGSNKTADGKSTADISSGRSMDHLSKSLQERAITNLDDVLPDDEIEEEIEN